MRESEACFVHPALEDAEKARPLELEASISALRLYKAGVTLVRENVSGSQTRTIKKISVACILQPAVSIYYHDDSVEKLEQ